MKQRLTKIALWIAGVLVFLGILSTTISYLYRDNIIEFVTQELGNQIDGTVTIEQVDLSFIRNFPNISIELHNVTALSTDTEKPSQYTHNTDTALVAQTIGLAFNPFDFLREKYKVQKISVHSASANYISDTQGKHNWMFIKESEDSTSQTFIELSSISVSNTTVHYFQLSTDIHEYAHVKNGTVSGNFTPSGFVLSGNADIEHKQFMIYPDTYINAGDFSGSFAIEQSNDSLAIKNITLSNSHFSITGSGSMPNDESIDITARAEIKDIYETGHILPESISSIITDYNINGSLSTTTHISGKTNGNNSPALKSKFSLTKGSATIKNNPLLISGKGIISSTHISDNKLYKLTNCHISCEYESNTFAGNISLINFEDPHISLVGDINNDLSSIQTIAETSDYTFEGNSKSTIKWKGTLELLTDFSTDFFSESSLEIIGSFSDVKITAPSDSPYNFDHVYGNYILKNSTLVLDSIRGYIQEKPFTLTGSMSSFIPSLFFDNESVTYNLKAYVESINANPFIKHLESDSDSEKSSSSTHQGTISCKTNHFVYDTYDLRDVYCDLQFSENEFSFSNTHFNTLDGKCNTNTHIIYTSTGIVCKGSAQLTQVSTNKLFKTFNNFDQNFLTHKQIDGDITSNVTFNATMDKEWNLIYPKLQVIADIIISNGNIRDFEPFIEMGKKLKVEEFNTVEFEKLENSIHIANDTLYIPEMDIRSNAFELKLSGKHSLSDDFLYLISVDLKKTLSKRFRRNNNMEDFGEIKETEDGDTQIPIKIIGNAEKFSIDFDFKEKIEQVKDGFQRQRSDWKEIINTPKTEETPKTEDEEIQTDFEIQYD
ncbi:MAG: AsmA-like C-terminal region-containing protein [Bacteroidales bacterium]